MTSAPATFPDARAHAREKLEQLTAVIGLRAIAAHQRDSQRNQEAESAHVRKMAWGATADPATESETMGHGHTVLGDITGMAPPQPSNLGPLLAAGLLAGGIPLAGLAGYLLPERTSEPPVTVPAADAADLSIRLGDPSEAPPYEQ